MLSHLSFFDNKVSYVGLLIYLNGEGKKEILDIASRFRERARV